MTTKPGKWRCPKRVVLYLRAGAIQGASDVPPGVAVEVRDYDTDGAESSRIKLDTDGDAYQSLVFGGPRKRAQRGRTTARQTRLRTAAPALLRACRQLHDALSEFLECPDPRTADRQAALTAVDASFAALNKADGASIA
jgi:hypothetical protein